MITFSIQRYLHLPYCKELHCSLSCHGDAREQSLIYHSYALYCCLVAWIIDASRLRLWINSLIAIEDRWRDRDNVKLHLINIIMLCHNTFFSQIASHMHLTFKIVTRHTNIINKCPKTDRHPPHNVWRQECRKNVILNELNEWQPKLHFMCS